MAFNEIVRARKRTSKTYAGSGPDAGKTLLSLGVTALHHESVPGSGVWDVENDLSHRKITDNPGDGWLIDGSGSLYFIGNPGPPVDSTRADGWVGFAGRKGGRTGNRWFWYRPAGLAYFDRATNAKQDILSFTYNRANLTISTETDTVGPNAATVNAQTVFDWADLWTQPDGSKISIEWVAKGGQLKQVVSINQQARAWIAANTTPSTPATQTSIGVWSEANLNFVPHFRKGLTKQNINNDITDFDVVDPSDRINGADDNAGEDLLFLLPIDVAWLESDPKNTKMRVDTWICKRTGKHEMFNGPALDEWNAAPAGTILIDPTINETVADGTEDGYTSTNGWSNTDSGAWVGNFSASFGNEGMAFRYTDVAVSTGSTVTDATLTVRRKGQVVGSTCTARITAHDVDTSPALSASLHPNDAGAWTHTTNQVENINVLTMPLNADSSFTCTDVVKELVDRPGRPATGWNFSMAFMNSAASPSPLGSEEIMATYEDNAAWAPRLEFVYTEGAGASPSRHESTGATHDAITGQGAERKFSRRNHVR